MEESNRKEQRGWELMETMGPTPGSVALGSSGRKESTRKEYVLRYRVAKAQLRRLEAEIPGACSGYVL